MTHMTAVQTPCLRVQCGSPCCFPVLQGVREGWGRCRFVSPAGPRVGEQQDVPYSVPAPAGSCRHCDRSLALRDLLGAGRRRANLGLGKVDEELSTATKENKPHSLTITSRKIH